MFQFILTFLWKCNIYNKEENNLYNIEILTKINGGIILAIGDIIVGIDIGTSKVCTVVERLITLDKSKHYVAHLVNAMV